MADINLSLISGALEQFIQQKVVRQYNRSSVTTNLLRKTPGKGKNLAWDVSIGTATGQIFDDGQIVTTFNSDTKRLATLPWSELGDAFKITGRAEDGAQFSQTELANQWLFELGECVTRCADIVNTQIWNGNGSAVGGQRLFGLAMTSNGPLSPTGTYANINRSVDTQFAGIRLSNGGVPRAVTLPLIEYGLEQVFNASGKQPTWGITTSNVWRLLCELNGSDRRVMQEVYVRGQKLNMSLGFHAVEVNGIPVFKDKDVPTGTLAFFHEESICIEFLPTAPSRIQRGKVMARVPIAGLPQEQDMTAAPPQVPLIGNVIQLPSGGNFDSWMLDTTCGLEVNRPNAHLVITDIAFRAA